MKLAAGANTYLHRDHLSSVRRITDATGSLSRTSDYEPYGQQIETVLAPLSPTESKSYIGERTDPETALTYLHARYYDALLGRFLQPDWWDVTDAGVGTNRYAYAGGDPVDGSDRNGHLFAEPPPAPSLLVQILKFGGGILGAAVFYFADTTELGRGDECPCGPPLDIHDQGNDRSKPQVVLPPIDPLSKYAGVGDPEVRQRLMNADPGSLNWANPDTLIDHFSRHGGDFDAKDANDYARKAQEFIARAPADHLLAKVDVDGTIRVYDPKSNTFGSYTKDGQTKTFFKPTSSGFWSRQPGTLVNWDLIEQATIKDQQ